MDTLSQFIADYRKRISALEDELKVARTKLEGMEEMRAAVRKTTETGKTLVLDGQTVSNPNSSIGIPADKLMQEIVSNTNKRLGRALSPIWQSILAFVGKKGSATLDQIAAFKPNIERKLIRSQLSYYTRQKIVNKDQFGAYSLTEYGVAACGIEKSESSSTSASNLGAMPNLLLEPNS